MTQFVFFLFDHIWVSISTCENGLPAAKATSKGKLASAHVTSRSQTVHRQRTFSKLASLIAKLGHSTPRRVRIILNNKVPPIPESNGMAKVYQCLKEVTVPLFDPAGFEFQERCHLGHVTNGKNGGGYVPGMRAMRWTLETENAYLSSITPFWRHNSQYCWSEPRSDHRHLVCNVKAAEKSPADCAMK